MHSSPVRSSLSPASNEESSPENFSTAERCRTVFDAMDRNHLGEVNVRDLIVALRRDVTLASFLHVNSKIKHEGSARTLLKLFAEIDADHG
jgi:hypothetical protein